MNIPPVSPFRVGVLRLTLFFPRSRTVEAGKNWYQDVCERLNRNFGPVSISMTEHDKWQRLSLAIAVVDASLDSLQKRFDGIQLELEADESYDVVESFSELFEI